MWAWGYNTDGGLGLNTSGPGAWRSSPTQIPGTTWSTVMGGDGGAGMATKTDGTLWSWGNNNHGLLGQNNQDNKISSPTQIPGTTWGTTVNDLAGGDKLFLIRKTDGTIWTCGDNQFGMLGQNNTIDRSSPVQIPGTWDGVDTLGSGKSLVAYKNA